MMRQRRHSVWTRSGEPLLVHHSSQASARRHGVATPGIHSAGRSGQRHVQSRRCVYGFRGDFFFGNLRGECIICVVLDGRRVLRLERLLEGRYGRIRDIAEDPAGLIYVSTSNRDGRGSPARDDDRILRLIPVP